MNKGYERFLEGLKNELLKEGGYTEDCIKIEHRQPEAQDRMLIKYKENEDTTELCALYTEEVYENFTRGVPMQKIMEEIYTSVSRAGEYGLSAKRKLFERFEDAKNFLFIRALNADKYSEQLQDAVYRRVGDIALVLFVEISSNEEIAVSSIVKKYFVERWEEKQQITEEELMDYALNQTLQTAPPRVYELWKIMTNLSDYKGDEFMELSQRKKISRRPEGNCISTEKHMNGAVAVFLPGVKEYLYRLLGDFYLAFTSVHEVMVHSAETMEPEMLKEILRQTIEVATSEEDYLSSKIYYYGGDEAGIIPVTE